MVTLLATSFESWALGRVRVGIHSTHTSAGASRLHQRSTTRFSLYSTISYRTAFQIGEIQKKRIRCLRIALCGLQVGNPQYNFSYWHFSERGKLTTDHPAVAPPIAANLGTLGWLEKYIAYMESTTGKQHAIFTWGDRNSATDAREINVIQEAGIPCR